VGPIAFAALVAASVAGCAPLKPIQVELPADAENGTYASALVGVEYDANSADPELFAIDLSAPSASVGTLPQVRDGLAATLSVFLYQQPLSALSLMAGPVSPAAASSDGAPIPPFAEGLISTVKGGAPSSWEPTIELSAGWMSYRMEKRATPSGCGAITLKEFALTPAWYTYVTMLSKDRALLGYDDNEGSHFAVASSTGTLSVKSTSIPLIRGLLYDGSQYVYAWDWEYERVVQFDRELNERGAAFIPGIKTHLTATRDAQVVYAFNETEVYRLTKNATAAEQVVWSEIKSPISWFAAVRANRMAAIADGKIWFYDGTHWLLESDPIAEGLSASAPSRISGDASTFMAVTSRDVLIRDEESRSWRTMKDPFFSIPKADSAGLGGGAFLVTGGWGAAASWDPQGMNWCMLSTGQTRGIDELATSLDGLGGAMIVDSDMAHPNPLVIILGF
jgi:hypothetical protein